jgi:hypothetical protein
MSIFAIRHRVQEEDKGGGGGGGNAPDWRAGFGAEAAPILKDFKEPGDFLKAYSGATTELTSLKATPPKFDWRKEVGGDDPEAKKVLERYTDPKAFYKAHTEAVGKIRSGELAKPLPKDASKEQVAEWRTANGIPAEAAAYFEKLPEGLVIGKDDQPIFEKFAAAALEANYTPTQMHAAIKWYNGHVEAEQAATQAQDRQDAGVATEALKKAWGADYAANKTAVMSFLDGLGTDLKAQFLDATLPDGRRLFNEPAVAQFLAKMAREVNPLGHLIPSAGEGDMRSLDGEIAEIEKLMKTDRKAYNKDTGKQNRLRQLYDAREKLQKKHAA